MTIAYLIGSLFVSQGGRGLNKSLTMFHLYLAVAALVVLLPFFQVGVGALDRGQHLQTLEMQTFIVSLSACLV